MKFEMVSKRVNHGDTLTEVFVKNVTDPKKWCEDTLQAFNTDLRPNESPREFVSVRVLDENEMEPEEEPWPYKCDEEDEDDEDEEDWCHTPGWEEDEDDDF